jgi:lipopolysaccharide/colanic/teichoic acid biosynthesis glycosyltransferase
MSIKRIFDFTIALILLLPASLALGIVSVLSLSTLGCPILFTQERIGYKERRFTLYKIRSMSNASDPNGKLFPDAIRLTRWGKFLRASSLDELPQLWNVLRGDMSLVGPRPLPPLYLPRYSVVQRRRHLVRPGITGWAQINGRNALTWEQKFELDVYYVDHQSLALDFKILALTALRLIRPRGINAQGAATMPEFMGSSAPRASADGPTRT